MTKIKVWISFEDVCALEVFLATVRELNQPATQRPFPMSIAMCQALPLDLRGQLRLIKIHRNLYRVLVRLGYCTSSRGDPLVDLRQNKVCGGLGQVFGRVNPAIPTGPLKF